MHDKRNRPTGVTFTEEYVVVAVAGGGTIGMPLYFFPWLKSATEEQRRGFQLGAWDVYWKALDAGIDLITMISGMYIKPIARPLPASPVREAPGTT